MHDRIYSYIIAIHNIYTRVWRVVILLMRAKSVGPARVNKKAYCVMRIYMQYVQCILYIAHTAHLFLHTFCIYNEV